MYIHWIIQSSYIILRKNGPQHFIFSLKYRNHFFLTFKVDWWKIGNFLSTLYEHGKSYMLFHFINTMLRSNKRIRIHNFWPDFFLFSSYLDHNSWRYSVQVKMLKSKVLKIIQTKRNSQQTWHFKFLWSPKLWPLSFPPAFNSGRTMEENNIV